MNSLKKKLLQSSNHSTLTTDIAGEKYHGQICVSNLCCSSLTTRTCARYDKKYISPAQWSVTWLILHLYSLPQPPGYSQIQKIRQRKSMNGHSSTAQSIVITLLVGTWQVILLLSEGSLYLDSWLRDRMFPGALSQMEGPIFFEVLATEAFNKSTFYCGAYERRQVSCSCGTGGRCYSRPAILTGEPIWNMF